MKAKSKVLPRVLYTSLTISSEPWIDVSMDSVLEISRSKNSIFMVVDMYSKIARFIPFHKIDATNLIDLFFREIVLLHSILGVLYLIGMLSSLATF